MKSSDNQNAAWENKTFLNDCLLWTLLADKNQCFSFEEGEKITLNEICYTSKAKNKLDINLFSSSDHQELITSWEQLYNQFISNCRSKIHPHLNYGLKQIMEFNEKTYTRTRYGNNIEGYKNSAIQTLKYKLNDFYKKFIEPKLEKY